MERPAHLLIQRRQVSPRKIAAISGALVFEAAAIYAVATGLTFSGIRLIPHTVQAEVLKAPPPKVQPVVLPQPQLVQPTVASVPPPEIQIQTPQPPPQITVAKMPPHPVMPAPVQMAAAPAPPAPPKPQGITAPVSIGGSHSCENEYPATAMRLNQEGTTAIKFTVNTDGSVSDAHVVNSSGHDTLDEAAIRCASSWRYKPALENGQPVAAPWTTNVQWKLQNGSTSM
jgi:protein TonB